MGQPQYAGPSHYAGQPHYGGQPQPAVPPVSAVIGGRRVPFNAHDGYTQRAGDGVRTSVTDLVTVAKPPAAPLLRLITNGSAVETRMSGARAGRDSTTELVLPADPTVSRVHAKFAFTNGRWWITSLGRNGVTLNGVPVAGDRPVNDGDTILWGRGPEALMSRVQIGG